jgi:LysR family hydrogen peroxide-inducible transcriptional activator
LHYHLLMNISQLRYLVAVADERHFGRAAEKCNVSQPTLSTQLKKLEDYLGAVFFERTNKSVDITPVGERAVAHARRALEEVEAIRAVSRGAGAQLSGPLSMGIIPTLCPYIIPWLLPRLSTAFPALELRVIEDVTANVVAQLHDHRLDAVLLAIPSHEPAVTELALFDEPFWVACPKDHPLARAEAISLKDLQRETILYVSEGHCLRDQTIAVCGAHGRREAARTDAFTGASLETLRRMVAASMGFTLLPAMALDSADAVQAQIACRPFAGKAYRRIGLVFRDSYPRADDMQRLAQCIREAAPASVMPVPE